MKQLIFVPTKEERARASRLCEQCINVLGKEKVEMQSFCLMILIDGFEKTAGIKMSALINSDYEEDEQ